MATASTRVDFPLPFSPTRNVTPAGSSQPSRSSCATAGIVAGHSCKEAGAPSFATTLRTGRWSRVQSLERLTARTYRAAVRGGLSVPDGRRYARRMPADAVVPFPDDAFRRVLCVVAHPDDVEYGTSSAVAAWTSQGIEVAYLLLTRGEAGMDGRPPDETAQLRMREQLDGSAAVGVTRVEFLQYPDGVLVYSLEMRRDIARVIRRFRPDAVLVGSWDVEFVAGLNQADHRVAGLAAVDAVRDAGNRWVFPELVDEGLDPWSPRWLLVSGDDRPTHGVDVTGEPLQRGIASLEAHREYLAGIPGHPPPRMMITGITALQGQRMGVRHAVLFRAHDFHAPPPIAVTAMQLAAAEVEAGEPR